MQTQSGPYTKGSFMARFKVREGTHYDPNPNWDQENPHAHGRLLVFKKGDIVTSDRPLDEIYVNKFDKLIESEVQVANPSERAREVDTLISSGGQWTNDDREFLLNLSDDGFRRIRRNAPVVVETKAELPVVSPLGEEVTSQFQRAYDEGFKVYRNPAGKHQVVRLPDPKPVNPSPLSAEKVDAFVDRYLKEK